jgi:hypothetical protein
VQLKNSQQPLPSRVLGTAGWSLHSGTAPFIFRSKEGKRGKRRKEKGVVSWKQRRSTNENETDVSQRMSSMLELVHSCPLVIVNNLGVSTIQEFSKG